MYDSDTGESLVAKKVFDITADCPSGERTILLFTEAKRGRIVQIAHPYDGQKYMGSNIHFFVDDLHRPVAPRDDTFGITAARAGLTRPALLSMIEGLCPLPNGEPR
jgi:hypothetical protein